MNNPVVHFEIGCRDKAVTEQFYAKLFDWKMAAMGPATHDRYRRRGHWRPHYVAGPRAAPLHHVLCDGGRLAGCARQGARVGRQDAGASGGDSHGKLRMVCRSGRQYGRDFQAKVAGRPERPPQAGGLPHWQPGYCQFRMTLPDWPLDITSKPCSKSVQWKRCVMTGVISRPDCSITVILYQVSYISRP